MKKDIAIIALFVVLISVMTFPLVFNLTRYLPGFFSTDELYATIWDSWRIKYSAVHHLDFKRTDFIAYPFGVDLFGSGFMACAYLGILYFLSIFTTPVLTFNIQIAVNLLLSLAIMYYLLRYLTSNRAASFFGAIVFGFSPYQFARVWQHISLTYNYLIALCCFAAILLREKPSRKQFFLTVAAVVLTFSLDYAVAYFALFVLLLFLLYTFLHNWKRKLRGEDGCLKQDSMFLKRAVLVAALSAVLLVPQFFPLIGKLAGRKHSASAASAYNPYHRSLDDLFSQSARPLSYFLPAAAHPVFGKFTGQFVGGGLYGESFTEHTLYLGWIPLLLAVTAFRNWRRLRKTKRDIVFARYAIRDTRYDFYIGFFIFLVIAAWFFSQPPWWKWGQLKIYMPSFFMYKILPMYRAYCRFGIVVILAIAVLAGFGLRFFMERFYSQRTRMAIAVLACALVLFEFWNWPPYKVIDISRAPPAYEWLKAQPGDFVIAEYPLDAKGSTDIYKLYQTYHEKKMINSTVPGTRANDIAKTMIKLSQPRTAGMLKGMGVKYVLVHEEEDYQGEISEEMEEMQKVPRNPGLKLIKSFPAQSCPNDRIMCVEQSGPIDVYEITAEALPFEP